MREINWFKGGDQHGFRDSKHFWLVEDVCLPCPFHYKYHLRQRETMYNFLHLINSKLISELVSGD